MKTPPSDRPAPQSHPCGLRARAVRSRSSRAPHWYWRIDYKRRAVWTGWAEPEGIATHLVELFRSGAHLQDPAGKEKARGGGRQLVTVADLMGAWLAAKQADPASKDTSMRAWTIRSKNVRSHVGEVTLAHLHREPRRVLDGYRQARLRQGRAPATVNVEIMALTAAWNWARERGTLRAADGSPLPPLPTSLAKVEEPDTYTPPLADVQATLAKLEHGWPRICLLLSLATGCRIGELGRLRWRDVRLDTDRPHLCLPSTKSGGSRNVPLGPGIVEVLEAWRLERDVGPTARVLGPTHWTVAKVGSLYWEPAAELAKVRPFRNHGLRRLFVTRLLDDGVDAKTVASITGHSVTVMLRDYVKPTDESRYAAVLRTGIGSPVPASGKVIKL